MSEKKLTKKERRQKIEKTIRLHLYTHIIEKFMDKEYDKMSSIEKLGLRTVVKQCYKLDIKYTS